MMVVPLLVYQVRGHGSAEVGERRGSALHDGD